MNHLNLNFMKLIMLCRTAGLYVMLLCMPLWMVSCKKDKTISNVTYAPNSKNSKNKTSSIDPGVINRLAPPSSISSLYSTSLNSIVSDDFNGDSVDMNQWQYRTDGSNQWSTSSNNVYIASTGSDRFVSIKGNYAEQKGSGITSKQPVKYGFYITKWRVGGYSDNTPNGWHPAIWGAGCDFSGSGNGNCIPEVVNHERRIEIDFVEGFESSSKAYWKSHILSWYQSSIYQDVTLKGITYQWPTLSSGWSILGLEYTPTYIKLWRYSSGTWSILKTIPITTAGSSDSNINVAYRTPVYWILSNKRSDPSNISANSWLHVDYFYLYDYVGSGQ